MHRLAILGACVCVDGVIIMYDRLQRPNLILYVTSEEPHRSSLSSFSVLTAAAARKSGNQ